MNVCDIYMHIYMNGGGSSIYWLIIIIRLQRECAREKSEKNINTKIYEVESRLIYSKVFPRDFLLSHFLSYFILLFNI